jgi:hypothetical protein
VLGADLRLLWLLDGFYRGHNIDALFCSLAQHAGRRAIAVIRSALRKDGALGLKALKEAGGAVPHIRIPAGQTKFVTVAGNCH